MDAKYFKLNAKGNFAGVCGIACFTIFIMILPAVSQDSLNSDQYFDRGCKEEADLKYEAAIADYDKAIKNNPQHWKAFANRATVRFNLHDYRGTIADLNIALAHLPSNPFLFQVKQRAEAALAIPPSPSTAGNAEAARRRANQMLLNAQLGGDFAEPSTQLTALAQRRGLVPNTVAGADMSDPASLLLMQAERRGQVAGTNSPYKRPVAQSDSYSQGPSPFTASNTRESNGIASNQNTGPFASASTPQESVPMMQGTAQNHFDRGCDKTAAMDFTGAIPEYSKAIELDPSMGKAYANRGSARFNTKDFRGALDDLNKAVELLPNAPAVKALRDQVSGMLNK
jgi:Tetratricopeptide repeat